MSRASSIHQAAVWWNEKKGATLFISLLVIFIVYSGSHTNKVWSDSSASQTKAVVKRPKSGADAAYQTFSAQQRGGGSELHYKALRHDEQKSEPAASIKDALVEDAELGDVDGPLVEKAGKILPEEAEEQAEETGTQQDQEGNEETAEIDGETEGEPSEEEEDAGAIVPKRVSETMP